MYHLRGAQAGSLQRAQLVGLPAPSTARGRRPLPRATRGTAQSLSRRLMSLPTPQTTALDQPQDTESIFAP
ncbi:hypothetical protein [Adlercreutzia rubneri]